jgi:glutaredoxin
MEEQNKEKTEPKSFFNKTTILGIVVLALIVGYGIYAKNNGKLPLTNPSTKTITLDDAKAKVEQFIKDNGGQATVKDVTEEGGLYKVIVNANNQDIPTYVSKDGTKFFPQAIDFVEAEKQAADAKKQQEESSKPAPKNDKPVVDLYVMSFCPYGNKAEDTIKPVYNLLKNKVDFNFHYIVTVDGSNITSLHGQKEVDQDERETCVLKNYGKDQWINFATYVNAKCGSDGSCWEAGAKSLGIDTAKISACVSSQGSSLMKTNADASNAAKASGSPTLIINGQNSQAVYGYGDSEAYKKAICDAFNTAPAECSKTLGSSTSTTQGGSCGS